MVGRKTKYTNPNPVPRIKSELPDFDKLMESIEPDIKRICGDLYKNWHKNIPDLMDEIKSTVMLFICIRWDLYKKGIIDDFPPSPGFIYISAEFLMQKQWAPDGDVCRYHVIDFYNTIESGCLDGARNVIMGKLVRTKKSSYFIATTEQNVPRNIEPSTNALYEGTLDIVDLWFLGLSVKELAIIYNLHTTTIRKRLHNYYDAMEINGAPILRPRLPRRKYTRNRFKTKLYRKCVVK